MPTVAHPKVVAVLGLGAMGAGVADDLRASGFDVISTAAGRSGQSCERASKANVRLLDSLAAVVAAADTFLSIVPADQAEPLATSVAAALKGKALHYVDCNSITPAKTARIAKLIEAAGAIYSDGGIHRSAARRKDEDAPLRLGAARRCAVFAGFRAYAGHPAR